MYSDLLNEHIYIAGTSEIRPEEESIQDPGELVQGDECSELL